MQNTHDFIDSFTNYAEYPPIFPISSSPRFPKFLARFPFFIHRLIVSLINCPLSPHVRFFFPYRPKLAAKLVCWRLSLPQSLSLLSLSSGFPSDWTRMVQHFSSATDLTLLLLKSPTNIRVDTFRLLQIKLSWSTFSPFSPSWSFHADALVFFQIASPPILLYDFVCLNLCIFSHRLIC